ncbi:protein of unknown function [Hyphomicrobium sp. MC1]|nr:protein of unknown function [Hyphomicrobium sp. MC1]
METPLFSCAERLSFVEPAARRVRAASFLTTDEKRAAAGYGAQPDSASPQLKYREDQPRVPAGNPDGGRWTDGGGAAGNGRAQIAQADDTPPPLRRLHSDETYATDRVAKDSLEYLRKQPTDALVESLKPSSREPLVTKPDGTIMQGNTRVKILEERGYDVNALPRTPYTTFRSGGGGMSGGSGGIRGPGDIGGGLKPSPLLRPRRSDFLN